MVLMNLHIIILLSFHFNIDNKDSCFSINFQISNTAVFQHLVCELYKVIFSHIPHKTINAAIRKAQQNCSIKMYKIKVTFSKYAFSSTLPTFNICGFFYIFSVLWTDRITDNFSSPPISVYIHMLPLQNTCTKKVHIKIIVKLRCKEYQILFFHTSI